MVDLSSNEKERPLNASFRSHAEVVGMLLGDYENLGNWRLVGEKYDLSKATVFDIARRNREPKDPKIRTRLGYRITQEVEVCPIHGVVHRSECPEGKKIRSVKVYKDLTSMPVSVLRWKLEHREEF